MALKTRAEREKLLKQKLAQTDMSSGGYSKRFWYPKEPGAYAIRFLPEKDGEFGGEMVAFFEPFGKHRLLNGDWVTCPKFTSDGEEDCPLCELSQKFYRSEFPEDKELAKQIRRQKQWAANVIVRSSVDDVTGATAEGPYVYTFGVTVMQDMDSLLQGADFGLDLLELEDGCDVLLTKKVEPAANGQKQTSYSVQGRRHTCDVHEDSDRINKIMQECMDLTPVYLTEDPAEDKEIMGDEEIVIRVLPYNRIIQETGYHPDMESEDLLELKQKASKKDTASGGGSNAAGDLKAKLARREKKRRRVEEDETPETETETETETPETESAGDVDTEFKEAKTVRQRRTRRK